jgi:crossover junction endodeoxyribonuclease RuvC
MRVLGIDPGSRITGFGMINVASDGGLAYVDSGCVRTEGSSQSQRLKTIYDGISAVITSYVPDVLVVEKVFMAKNADSALKLGQARGVAIMNWRRWNIPHYKLSVQWLVMVRHESNKSNIW